MNDPHVEALHYTIQHGDHVDYSRAPAVKHETPGFTVTLSDGKVSVAMKAHFGSIAEARAVVEPFLRAWELEVALSYGPRSLEFHYKSADIVDRNPRPGVIVMAAEGASIAVSGGSATGVVGLASYPTPPMGMARDPIVDLMFERYLLYRNGGTTLADAAYYCRTCLGRAPEAKRKFAVADSVLGRLQSLSSNKGGTKGRKRSSAPDNFTPREEQWLEDAMRLLIRRAAEVAFDPTVSRPQITLADLPPL